MNEFNPLVFTVPTCNDCGDRLVSTATKPSFCNNTECKSHGITVVYAYDIKSHNDDPLAHQKRPQHTYRMVIIESPYAGNPDIDNEVDYKADVERNKRYLDACMRDCILNHKDAPFASHKLYTDSLDDNNPAEREIGILAGFAWGCQADAVVVYYDFGVSEGMKLGIANAEKNGVPVEMRRLPKCLMDELKWNTLTVTTSV